MISIFRRLRFLEEYLEDFPGVVITVSHDRYFLDRTADHLFVFEGEGRVTRFYGNYTEYMESVRLTKQAEAEKRESKPAEASEAAANDKREPNRPRKLSYKEQKEWDEIEGIIAGLEERLAHVRQEIEKAGSDYGKVQELYREEQELTVKLEQTMDRWAELSELVETIARNK